MVTTRHSLPHADKDEGEQSDVDENSAAYKAAMKKLHIDALPALKGEAVKKEESTAVYHWRGSIYAVSDSTPQEWLDASAQRHGRKDGRKSAAPQVHKGDVKKPETGKRARSANQEDAGDSEDGRPAKRTRRHTNNPPTTVPSSYSRPCKESTHTIKYRIPSKQTGPPPDRAQDGMQTRSSRKRRRGDDGNDDEEDTVQFIARGRRRAEELGYEITPLSDESLRSRDEQRLETAVRLAVARLAKVNARIEQVTQEFHEAREVVKQALSIAATDDRASEEQSPPPANDQPNGVQQPTPSTHSSPGSSSAHDPGETSDPEATGERRTARHDSASSVPDSYKPPRPTKDLPTKARGGQDLRWSLPAKIGEVGRAEEAINRKRMKNESHGARRRRVRREMQLVHSWEEITPDATNSGADDRRETEATPPATETDSSPRHDGGSSGERRSSRVERYKTRVCRDWVDGVCVRGARCTYLHARAPEDSP